MLLAHVINRPAVWDSYMASRAGKQIFSRHASLPVRNSANRFCVRRVSGGVVKVRKYRLRGSRSVAGGELDSRLFNPSGIRRAGSALVT